MITPLLKSKYTPKQEKISLRGGGCGCSSIPKDLKDTYEIAEIMPENFYSDIKAHLLVLIDKAKLSNDENSKEEILISIQWFSVMKEYLNIICLRSQLISSSYDIIMEYFPSLLKSSIAYLRSSGFLCVQILQIANDLARVLFSFFLTNSKRFFKKEEKDNLEEIISEIETQIDVESQNTLMFELNFQAQMLKGVIASAPSDSDEQTQVAIAFLGGLYSAITTFTIDMDAIIGGAKFLLHVYKTNDLKKKYEVYYYFEILKFRIVLDLKKDSRQVFSMLTQGYKFYIEGTNDWLLNCCWIKMIAFLISYRPIVSKSQFGLDKVQQQQNWNMMIQNKYVSPLSCNKNLGRLLLFLNSQNSEGFSFETIDILQKKTKSFEIFQESLLEKVKTKETKYFVVDDQEIESQIQDYLKQFIDEVNRLRLNLTNELKQDHLSGQKTSFEELLKRKTEEREMLPMIDKVKKSAEYFIKSILNQVITTTNHQLKFQLILEKGKLIVEAISFKKDAKYLDNQKFKQDLLAIIQELEQAQSKSNEKCLALQQQKRITIQSVIQLTFMYEKLFRTSKQQLQFQDNSENKIILDKVDSFMTCFSDLKVLFTNITTLYEKLTTAYSTKKQDQIFEFGLANPLAQAENLIINIININHIQMQLDCINEIKNQNTSKVQFTELNNQSLYGLSSFYTIQQLLEDVVNQMNNQLDILQKITYFFEQNMALLKQRRIQSSFKNDNSEENIESKDWIIDMMTKQFENVAGYFTSEERRRENEKGVDYMLTEETINILKFDQTKLKNLKYEKEKEQEVQKHKQLIFTMAVIEQSLIQYQKTPQKLHIIKEQVFQMYSKILGLKTQKEQKPLQVQQIDHSIPNNDEESSASRKKQLEQIQNQDEIEEKQNILPELKQSITSLEQAIAISKNIVELISDNQTFYENVWRTEISLSYQSVGMDIIPTIFQANETSNQQQLFTKLKENIKLVKQWKQIVLKKEEQQIGTHQSSSAAQIETLLLLIDQINDRSSVSPTDQGILGKAKQAIFSTLEEVGNQFEDESYKVRQCFVLSLLQIQSVSLEQHTVAFCQANLVYIWGTEKDERVKALLKNTELLDIQKKLFSSDLKTCQKRILEEMKQKLQNIKDLEQQCNQGRNDKGQEQQQLQAKLQQSQQDFEEYLENINTMASKLDISLLFLREILKELQELKSLINKLSENISEMGDDIRRLRGKNFQQLLDIRKQKVLEQKEYSDLHKIYISLRVQEYNPITGIALEQTSELFDEASLQDTNGEVNEFLKLENQQKDVMLIRGVAGSGKSRAAAKIEEFLWNNDSSGWKPIYVSLPSLKQPKFNLLDQALSSEFYQFDKIQIREFKEAMAQKELKVILILDSYDEMKQECIQSNLYQTNRLIIDLFGETSNNNRGLKEHLKLIITTRSEILSQSRYQTWFCGESLESLKEVEILSFDENQQQDYLQKYTLLTVKQELFELYEFVKSETKDKVDLSEFKQFWNKVSKFLQEQKDEPKKYQDSLVNEKQVNDIISSIKSEICFRNISKEQIINLSKKLKELWSVQKFQKLINNVNIQHILTTPFMMEIVVQVLPSMITKYSDATVYKDKVIEKFIQIKKQIIIDTLLIRQYQKEKKSLFQIKEIEKKEEQSGNLDEYKLKELAIGIWDQLEQEKYFQIYSLIDKQRKEELRNIIHLDDVNMSIIIRALVVKTFTVYDFYLSFIEFYHQRQIKKLSELGRVCNYESLMIDLFNFSQSLALNLTIRQLTQIKQSQKGQLSLAFSLNKNSTDDEWQDEYFNDFTDNGDYKKLVRSCILLNQKGSNYSFTHKSIQEFYVAEYILKIFSDINLINENDFQLFILENGQLKKKDSSNQVKMNQSQQATFWALKEICSNLKDQLFNKDEFNLSRDDFKGTIGLIKDEMKQCYKLKEKLINIVKLSQISLDFRRAASNSIFLLGFNNEFLGFQQLQNIKISDTDLYGLSFYESDLSGSEFNYVSINSCNFNNANLKNVQWKNIICNESPMLSDSQGQQMQKQIEELIFSSDSQYLIKKYEDDITLWEVKTGMQIGLLSEWKVLALLCKEEGQIFLAQTSSKEKRMMIQLWENQQLKLIASHDFDTHIASFQPDGKFLAYQIMAKTHLIELEKKTERSFESINAKKIFFSPSGKFLAQWNGASEVQIYNQAKQESNKISSYKKEKITEMKFSQDESLFIFSGEKYIQFWNLQVSQYLELSTNTMTDVKRLAISTDQKIIATYTQLKQVILWDIQSGKLLAIIECSAMVTEMSFLPDNSALVLYQEGQNILIYSIKSEQQQNYKDAPSKLIISNDGILITLNNLFDIILWNTKEQKQQAILKGHKGKLTDMVFSPDGKILISQSEDDTLKIWDVKKSALLQSVEKQQGIAHKIAFQSDGSILAFCILNKIVIWDLKDKKKGSELQTKLENPNIEFSPQSNIIIIWSDQKIELWNIAEGKNYPLEEKHKASVSSIVFSQNGAMFASYSRDSQILLWSGTDGKFIKGFSNKEGDTQEKIFFQPDGQIFIFFDKNGVISFWNTQTMEQFNLYFEDNPLEAKQIAFSKNDKLFATVGTDNYILLWDTDATIRPLDSIKLDFIVKRIGFLLENKAIFVYSEGGDFQLYAIEKRKFKLQAFLQNCIDYCNQYAFSLESQMLAISATNNIQLWNCNKTRGDQPMKSILNSENQEFFLLVFSRDGKTLATLSKTKKTILIWEVESKKIISSINFQADEFIQSESYLIFSPIDELIAFSCGDRRIRLWDVKLAIQVAFFECQQKIRQILFTPDGQTLATQNEDSTLSIWNVKAGKAREREGHSDDIIKILFSPDGQILASCSKDKTIKLWDAKDGKQIDKYDDHKVMINDMDFSPDGHILAFCFENKIKFWDIKITKQKISFNEGENENLKHTSIITKILFSPNQSNLASCCQNKILYQDANTGKILACYEGDLNYSKIVFSPDGTTLVWCCDNKVYLQKLLFEESPLVFIADTLIQEICFQLDGEKIIARCQDGKIIFVDVKTMEQKNNFSENGLNGTIFGLSPDNKYFALCQGDNTFKIYQFASGQTRQCTFSNKDDCINQILYSPNGRILVTCYLNGRIVFWNPENGAEIAQLDGHAQKIEQIIFSPDGLILASFSKDKAVRLWDITTEKYQALLCNNGYENNSNSQKKQMKPQCFKIISKNSLVQAYNSDITGSEIITESGGNFKHLFTQQNQRGVTIMTYQVQENSQGKASKDTCNIQ